ncbi:hypothetical protein GSI_11716 [Ganoderma sinense ZZ0214-1]|uniref:DUF1365 domain-containing protein n=1 Tax=Ganoderma sinense ZZ0214-1 TaxID=1077348 RepID=A0A2G8RWS2_9APHY|nr:hypothetical protein GSI_11716 [Ganoderma sinense ZZ0214-1]
MFAAAAASVVALAASAVLYLKRSSEDPGDALKNAYILENSVTHARLLPAPSTHAFTYPTLAFFLSLDALESHALDLGGGWLFGYGGTSWRVTGLRSNAYLLPETRGDKRETRGIKAKLREVLVEHGHDGSQLGDAWMLTMPSYMGYEGINPLSVHYCYTKDQGRLAWVVFEIHNTFGEKHIHVLVPGVNEDKNCPNGFDHSWTVPRDFHVSPFNDRQGHYAISISAPPPPRSPALVSSPPRPKIRIHLHAAAESSNTASASTDVIGPLKLTATQFARSSVPFTSRNLGHALMKYPLALFLSFVRILYHAYLLHYVKGLDVFPRPDPKPAAPHWGSLTSRSIPGQGEHRKAQIVPRVYGGIGWQDEGPVEAYARRITEDFFARRAEELRMDITLVSGDPSVPDLTFSPWAPPTADDQDAAREELIIHYTAPRFFTTLLLAPTAEHLLLLRRTDDLFRVSSDELFVRMFSVVPPADIAVSWTQQLRTSLLPRRFVSAVPITPRHPLDSNSPRLLTSFAVCLLHFADAVEKNVFTLLRARFVPGTEPWRRWERAAAPGS